MKKGWVFMSICKSVLMQDKISQIIADTTDGIIKHLLNYPEYRDKTFNELELEILEFFKKQIEIDIEELVSNEKIGTKELK